MKATAGPAEIPIIGSILDLRRDPPRFFAGLAAKYGDVVRFTVFGREALLFSDPELIKEVLIAQPKNFRKSRGLQLAKALLGDGLLTSEGDLHKRQRKLASPAFAKSRMGKYGDEMVRITREQAAGYAAGETVDANQLMMRLTLAIVNKTLFDADVTGDAPKVAAALEVILNNMDRLLNPFTEIMNMLPLPSTLRLREATESLNTIVYRIIAERRASPEDRGDLLSIFMAAQDEEADGARMTDKQIRDECLTLFIAGHETTANALAWTLYLLAKNPEWVTKARAEIKAVTGGSSLTATHFPQLKILYRIFAEALRLYPPAWTISREASVDTQVGGYDIAAGTTVVMSQWVMHRHPRYWPDANAFDPDRFLPENEATRPKFAYFPFGGGPRQCIGDQFAWMEGVLILAVLLEKFTPQLTAPGYEADIHPMITLRPRGGMPLVFAKA
ncbi:MAG: cytochrome P450 [Spirochaetes bacterium]|nr:cytochrome P450 [Spirochaetota bacterium]